MTREAQGDDTCMPLEWKLPNLASDEVDRLFQKKRQVHARSFQSAQGAVGV
jgi:hypothetical protein